MRYVILLFLSVSSLWGQTVRSTALIVEYLGITEVQAERIRLQNDTFTRYTRVRTQRIMDVQAELAAELARSPLDPEALGVRSAEIESIRREIAERNLKLIADNLALLTEAQRAKLKALEDAIRLIATANQGQTLKVIPDDCANLSSGLGGFSGLGLNLGLCSPTVGALSGLLP